MLLLPYLKSFLWKLSAGSSVFHQISLNYCINIQRRLFMPFYDNVSLIFPIIQPLPQVLGEPRLKTEVIRQIQSDPDANAAASQRTVPLLLWTYWHSFVMIVWSMWKCSGSDMIFQYREVSVTEPTCWCGSTTWSEKVTKTRKRNFPIARSDLSISSFSWKKVLLFSTNFPTNTYTVHSLALIPE